MSQEYSSATKGLLEKLEELQREVISVKNAINLLREMEDKDPLFGEEELGLKKSSRNIRPDQYYGKPFATAVREYLESVDSACVARQIIEGLTEGGFDFKAQGWEEGSLLRTVSMMLGKNNKTFHRLPNNTYGLLRWYPEIEKRNKKAKKQEIMAEEEIQEQETESENDSDSPS